MKGLKDLKDLFQDPNKTIQLKKRKKVLKDSRQRNQIIHKGKRCHEISPKQHKRPGNMGSIFKKLKEIMN